MNSLKYARIAAGFQPSVYRKGGSNVESATKSSMAASATGNQKGIYEALGQYRNAVADAATQGFADRTDAGINFMQQQGIQGIADQAANTQGIANRLGSDTAFDRGNLLNLGVQAADTSNITNELTASHNSFVHDINQQELFQLERANNDTAQQAVGNGGFGGSRQNIAEALNFRTSEQERQRALNVEATRYNDELLTQEQNRQQALSNAGNLFNSATQTNLEGTGAQIGYGRQASSDTLSAGTYEQQLQQASNDIATMNVRERQDYYMNLASNLLNAEMQAGGTSEQSANLVDQDNETRNLLNHILSGAGLSGNVGSAGGLSAPLSSLSNPYQVSTPYVSHPVQQQRMTITNTNGQNGQSTGFHPSGTNQSRSSSRF